jgi:uncharacterized membrane protein YphA (DoxX/SURF4 family)
MTNMETSRQDVGLLILRLSAGLLFFWGGLGKFIGPALGGPPLSGFAEEMVWGQLWLAVIVAGVELLAGAALIAGLFSRYAAVTLGIITLVALATVHLPGNTPVGGTPLGVVFIFMHIALLGQLCGIALLGSGKLALKNE